MSKSILYAKNLSEIIKLLKSNPTSQIVGGCTGLESLPDKSITIKYIKELTNIIRHERFIEVGPAVTLSQLLELGPNHLPQVLYEALNTIANPIIRNMATIGGNICSEGQKLTLYAPLMALDTKLEFKNQVETKSESIRTFKDVPAGYVLTNIKIPLVDSDISIFRRIGPENTITQQSASYAFLAATEKKSLIGIQMAFAGPFSFSSKNLENALLGKRLPLTQKDIDQIEELVYEEFQKASTDQMIGDEVRQQFFNLVRYSFEQLT